MTDVPDFRGRVQRDVPTDFLHKLMNKIPGYTGYADRERRRDADKMLRTWLGKQYRDQLTRLTRVEQDLARSGHLTALPELERLEGMLNRFIDKLETASYGYAGLFDAARVTETELEQLYAFDQALADGVQTIAGALDAVAAGSRQAGGPAPASPAETLPDQGAAAGKLGDAIDHLLATWTHRNDVLASGQAMPPQEFDRFRAATPTPPATPAPSTTPPTGPAPGEGQVTTRLDPSHAPPMGGAGAADHASMGTSDPATGRTSLPGGAGAGGNVGPTTGQPLVGGGESFGSPAPYAGAAPEATTQTSPDAPPISPDAADGTHSTMGTSGGPTGGQ